MTPRAPPPRAGSSPPVCAQHGAVAGWECTVCQRPLCPDCAAVRVIPPVSLLACGHCGELAEPLLRLKSQAASLLERIPSAFTFPLQGEGLPAWLGVALWLWATALIGPPGVALGWSVALASFYGLTRSTARGHEHLELSDFRDPLTSVMLPMVRLALVTLPAWGGALVARSLERPGLGWLALGVAALWAPTAYIGAATGTSLLELLNPVRVLGATARLGKDAGVYVAATVGVSLLFALALPLSMLVDRLVFVPVLGGVLAQLVLTYPAFVGARLAGTVLMLHGPVFGWGEELDRYEPVLGATQPRGALPEKERTLPKHLPSEIELPPEAPPPGEGLQPAQRHERFAAIELSPDAEPPPEVTPLDAALLPSLAEQSAEAIRKAITAHDAETALDGFRSTGLTAAPALSFDELVWLGQTAASRIDYESAELAFSQASTRSAPAEALGRARVMLARLLAERLQRRDEATRWMERIVAEQPGTNAAQYAQAWLTGPH
jgi:hypothetical protein